MKSIDRGIRGPTLLLARLRIWLRIWLTAAIVALQCSSASAAKFYLLTAHDGHGIGLFASDDFEEILLAMDQRPNSAGWLFLRLGVANREAALELTDDHLQDLLRNRDWGGSPLIMSWPSGPMSGPLYELAVRHYNPPPRVAEADWVGTLMSRSVWVMAPEGWQRDVGHTITSYLRWGSDARNDVNSAREIEEIAHVIYRDVILSGAVRSLPQVEVVPTASAAQPAMSMPLSISPAVAMLMELQSARADSLNGGSSSSSSSSSSSGAIISSRALPRAVGGAPPLPPVPVLRVAFQAMQARESRQVVLGHNARVRHVIDAVRGAGWELDHFTGSHRQFRHPQQPQLGTLTIPGGMGNTIPIGTLNRILRQSGLR